MLPVLLLSLLAANPNSGVPDIINNGRVGTKRFPAAGGDIKHLFTVANDKNTGMGTVCAGTAVTATGGQTVTFSRASSAFCNKGLRNGPLNNGDLVSLTTDKPRVQYEPDKSGGRLGLWYEPAATNLLLQSSAFENAAWNDYTGTGGSAVVVTANAAVAPDGTTTARRLQVAATSGTQASMRYQDSLGSAGGNSVACWFKGNASSGTIDLVKYNAGAGTFDQIACPFDPTGWRWCVVPAVNSTASSGAVYIGNATGAFSVPSRLALDVFAWGCSFESGSLPTSTILTTTVAVTRAADFWTVARSDLSTAGVTNADGCIGADTYQPSPSTDNARGCGIAGSGGTRLPYLVTASRLVRTYDGTNQSTSSAISSTLIFDQILSLAGRWKTGTGLNGWSPSIGDGTLQASYNDFAFNSAAVQLGTTDSGCGVGSQGMWLTRIRFDTFANGCH